MEGLILTGGGKRAAETWWLYWGAIPFADFRAVRLREDVQNTALAA